RRVQLLGVGDIKELATILVNRLVVVHDQEARSGVLLLAQTTTSSASAGGPIPPAACEAASPACGSGARRRSSGSRRANVAPLPSPSLLTVSGPPSSLAASAAECSPKPCPVFLVVNPC